MLKFLSKLIDRNCEQGTECSICQINRTLKLTFLLMPIRGRCQHLDKNYTGKPCFRLVNRWIWITYVLVTLLSIAFIVQFRDVQRKLIESDELSVKIDGLIALEELIYFLFFLMMYITTILTCRKRLNYLNAVTDLIDNKYFIEIFGTPWSCMMNTKIKKTTFAIGFGIIVSDVFLALVYQQSNIVYINICFILTVLMITTMGIQIFRELTIIVQYRMRIDNLLINSLKYKMGCNDVCVLSLEERPRDTSFEVQLRATELYYSEFYSCIEDHLNSFMGPLFILWCMSSLIMLVMDFYMMVLLIEKGMWHKNLMDELRTYIHIFGVIFLMRRGTLITNVSDDTLSFLFKYPISKLSETEAYQVEMLIYTLSSQKPTIKASDIFTVGTKLLASISGTVVTYVLVALQFRPAWRD